MLISSSLVSGKRKNPPNNLNSHVSGKMAKTNFQYPIPSLVIFSLYQCEGLEAPDLQEPNNKCKVEL